MIEKAPLPYTFHWKIVPLSHIYLGTLHLFSCHQTGQKKKYALKFRRGCKIYRKCNPHSWFRSLFEAFVQIVTFKVRKREQNWENLDNVNRIKGYLESLRKNRKEAWKREYMYFFSPLFLSRLSAAFDLTGSNRLWYRGSKTPLTKISNILQPRSLTC